ncbi:SMP-30/gluconolactonase/LRE family protein [Streptomyces sp. NPDC093228]|uniref:SMP-30/gluconolactonase/LRE family protein n=1 Tax=Streptomyces sp. NPDC093228 TaxID=3155070 RepID=UPI00343205DE
MHYDLAAGQQPENVTLEPNGDLDVVLSQAGQIERVTPGGHRSLLATLPVPADGGVNTPVLGFRLATGLVRTADGTLYVGYATGDDATAGIWRIRPGGKPQRIVALKADSFPNGMALDEGSRQLYFADSTKATIWRVSVKGGTPTAWATGQAFERHDLLGVNGLKLHNGAVWVSNSDQATLLRVPILRSGAPGTPQIKATNLTFLDDFVFVGPGDTVVGALNLPNQVVLIRPNGTRKVILTGDDGLEGPTSVALLHDKLYVLSAAFVLQNDPNIVVANFSFSH